jgi:hypothetical protein
MNLKEVFRIKANRQKVQLAMARACLGIPELEAATQIPVPTIKNVLSGRGVRPATLGKVAAALGVDPTEILEEATA